MTDPIPAGFWCEICQEKAEPMLHGPSICLPKLRADAERYRWLRRQGNTWHVRRYGEERWYYPRLDTLDVEIDKAMLAEASST